MMWFLWLLVLYSAVGGQDLVVLANQTSITDSSWTNQTAVDRNERFFSFFNVIRFRNVQCTAVNGQYGTCYSRQECTRLGGVASGGCARNWGTCCVIQKTCGSSTNLNCTYFTNPDFPKLYTRSDRCSISVSKCNSNICQLRIDFLDFSLAQPDNNGNCVEDHLEVTGGASPVPIICGENSGQHVYVDFQEDNVPIQISIRASTGASVSRKWNIKVSQIDCASPERAPAGALMYYRALTDTVKSFNYGRGVDQSGTRQIANTNYGVFVRAGLGYCSITWSQVSGDVYTFTVSGDTEVLPTDLLGTSAVALSGENCVTDFIVIPNPSQGGTSLTTDRFCGNALVSTTTSARPFVLNVVTDDTEVGNDFANRGFNLMYRQLPCD